MVSDTNLKSLRVNGVINAPIAANWHATWDWTSRHLRKLTRLVGRRFKCLLSLANSFTVGCEAMFDFDVRELSANRNVDRTGSKKVQYSINLCAADRSPLR